MNKIFDRIKLWLLDYLLRDDWNDGSSEVKEFDAQKALTSLENMKAGRILLKQFVEVLFSSGAMIGRIERILQSMRIPTYLMMHSVLAKCLLLLDVHPKARLAELHAAGILEAEFGIALNTHLAAVAFDKTRQISKIRELYAEEIFDGIGRISLPLSISNEASHHENHMDMMFVVAVAKHRNAKRIFEFGTYMGRTTVGLASIDADATVTTLNLDPSEDTRYGPYIGKLIKDSPYGERITQIFSDSNKFDTTPYAKSMDYIFIDADHSYDAVRNDTEKSLEMLAPGGVIVWHDYAPKSPGVYGYLQELSLQRSLFRIKNTCLVLYIDGVNANEFQPKSDVGFLEDVS